MRAVEAEYDVVGLDVDGRRIDRLLAGDSYVEDISSAELAAALRSGRYLPTSDYDRATAFDYAVVTVPTPLRDGVPDLCYIEDAMRSLAPYVSLGATVILASTTYP